MLPHRIVILLLVAVVMPTTIGCGYIPAPFPTARVTAPSLNADEGTALALRAALEGGAEAVAGGGGSSTLSDPTGWATLTGHFQLDGTAPRMNPLKVDKDTAVCAPGGIQVLAETMEVSTSGGIKNVLIYLDMETPADDPNWEHPSYLESRTGKVLFDQKACIFLSHVIGMRSTQTLRIVNSDPVLHNTNIQATGNVNSANPSVPSNSETTYQPGAQSDRPFPIACSIHPWMSAWMITRDSPYFAVSDADGNFQIANVPAGEGVELRFRVWQEKAGFLQKGITVNGQSATWSKGRFPVTLTPDETRNMDVVVDASVFDEDASEFN